MGYFRRRPKVTKGRLRGENPVRLRACALAHRIFPLRTPDLRGRGIGASVDDRRGVIRIAFAFVFAQPLSSSQSPLCSVSADAKTAPASLLLLSPQKPLRWVFAGTPWRKGVRRAPTTRLTRRSRLKGWQFYRGKRAAAGGRSRSNQVLRAGQSKFQLKGLPRRGYIRGGQPLIRAFGDLLEARSRREQRGWTEARARAGDHRSPLPARVGGKPRAANRQGVTRAVKILPRMQLQYRCIALFSS